MIGKTQSVRDKRVYDLAKEYLLIRATKLKKLVTADILEEYLFAPPKPTTVQGIYERILGSAQNANMKAGVIGGSIDGISNLRKVLCGFQPAAIERKYSSDWGSVLNDINKKLRPRVKRGSKINKSPSGLWSKYCKTILASAHFMKKFSSADDFYLWVDFFYKDERSRPALPLLLASEIYGFGLALACDFLKELGYLGFGKPDVHLKNIFESLSMCPRKSSDYQLLHAIQRVAENAGVTPYAVDKVFWLIGSGKFYNHKIKIGRSADDFIRHVKRQKI